MRRYNERLILSAVRRSNGASKAELARLTELSPQAVVRIVEQLEEEGMLFPAGKRTGGMGQPSTIYQINGNKGCTIGVEIGRHGLNIALLDFDGQLKADARQSQQYPSVGTVVESVLAFIDSHVVDRDGLIGIGIAMPWFLGEWRDELGLSPQQAGQWQGKDVEAELGAGIGLPLTFENDGNAAALAQLLCGAGRDLQNFLSISLGTFVGGGLVLGGRIVQGRHGNAGALASMPLPDQDYLIHHASLYNLPTGDDDQLQAWIDRCAKALAFAIIGANSLLDLEAVIIDGAIGGALLDQIMEELDVHLRSNVPPDFFRPAIRKGTLGDAAGVIGAGLLPLHASFSPDLTSLFKTTIR